MQCIQFNSRGGRVHACDSTGEGAGVQYMHFNSRGGKSACVHAVQLKRQGCIHAVQQQNLAGANPQHHKHPKKIKQTQEFL